MKVKCGAGTNPQERVECLRTWHDPKTTDL